ncbi:MAG: hypothetical protein Q8M40_00665 [Legionella sp.]|nr:hypothetical protein [Legionella sp.]
MFDKSDKLSSRVQSTTIVNNSIFKNYSGNLYGTIKRQQKIQIIIVGETHTDPCAKSYIANAVSKLVDKKIPITYCSEKPCNLTNVISVSERLKKVIDTYDEFITDNKLHEFFCLDNGHKRPYLSPEGKTNLKKSIFDLFNTEDPSISNGIFSDIITLNSRKEELKILNLIIDNNLNYVPIDFEIGTNNALDNLITECSFSNIVNTEQERTDIMIDNLFKKAMPPLMETCGIIICNVGLLHAHRLAAKIFYKLDQNPEIYKNIDIKINSLFLYSDYLENNFEEIISDNERLKCCVDKDEIKNLYNIIPFLPLGCVENKDNSDFYHPTLEDLVNSSIEDFANKKSVHPLYKDTETSEYNM